MLSTDPAAAPAMTRRDLRRQRQRSATDAATIAATAAAAVTIAATTAAEAAQDDDVATDDTAAAAASVLDEDAPAQPVTMSDAELEPAADEEPSGQNEQPADDVASAQPESPQDADDVAPAEPEVAPAEPEVAPAEPDAEQNADDEAPVATTTKRRFFRRRAAGARRRAAAPSAPTAPATASRHGRARTIGAALAIVSLVGGTALPALGMTQAGDASAMAASTAGVDIQAQSLTVSTEALPKVEVRGDFGATTPEQLDKIHAAAAAAARSGITPIAEPGQVIIPMAAGTYTMTDGFGANRPGRTHMGQDYAAAVGTPIYAAADGVVTMSQDSYGGYGVTVQVQHQLGGSSAVSTLYGHMSYGTRAVEAGEHVVAGQFLGRVGTTGYTIGSCLHFEVHINGSPINPVPWLAANVR